MKYVIYARKSTESEDRQAISIESQIFEMKDLAKRDNIKIIDVLQESKSAKEPGRPVFNELMKKMQKGYADGILCWKLDRLARNPIDAGTVQWLLQKNIIKQIKTFERDYNPEDNVVMASIELSMANQYIRDLSKNVKRGLDQKVRRGEYPATPPVGYMRDYKTRQVILDGEKWKYVLEAFRLYATGMYSIESLTNKMNSDGMRTIGQKLFFPSGMHRLLTNPIYYGYFRWKDMLHKGNHPEIVSKNLFDKVQEILFPRKHTKRDNKRNFTFRGFLTCGECGLRITAETSKDHTYYRCTKSRGTHNCSQKYLREEDLIDEIGRKLNEFNFNDEIIDLAIEASRENGKNQWKRCIEIEKHNKVLLERNIVSQKNLVEKFVEGKVPEVLYNQMLAELRNEEAVIEDKLRSVKENYRNVFEVIETMARFAKLAHGLFNVGDNERKKMIISLIASNIVMKDKKVEKIELAEPFCWIEEDIINMKTPKSGNLVLEPLFDALLKAKTTSEEVVFCTGLEC
ncbi:MAG: recombinase family protein [Candidatus Moranbacteria bacterium]|nr:recombinase family protein [Candidatus Moranbacteria bacterium]